MTLRIGRDAAKQTEAALGWINTVAISEDRIIVEFPGYQRFFYFQFPLRHSDPPKPLKAAGSEELTFIILNPRPNRATANDHKWRKIFSTPDFEILESKTRALHTPPLRWKLNDQEKETVLRIARDALTKFLSNGERLESDYFRTLPQRFLLKTDLDAAIWTNGQLRGSSVVENKHLGEGIAEAAILASHDARFKPLAADELQNTRIEITLMCEPRIPLSIEERKKNIIYTEKGYLLERGSSKGWYLPEVFNSRRFRNLEEFLSSLAEEKAKLNRSVIQDANVFIFEVDDFIELANCSSALTLRGPIVKIDSLTFGSKFVIRRLCVAADWLCYIQEPDGNIPPVINPLTGHQTQIDWPRFAFTAWALAEFGKATQKKKYLLAAEKSFGYLRNYLIYDSKFLIPSRELTLAYFSRLSLALGKSKDAALAAEKILVSFDNISFEPIIFSQIASFLKVLPDNTREYSQMLENICRILKNAFEKNRWENISMSLAAWAELVNTFFGIDDEFSKKVTDWLKIQQLPSGAFPESTVSDFVYTRGTSKIFEALALGPKKNKEALDCALQWLLSMQYNEENMFFVSEEIRPKIFGGFRHDYFNHEAWVDAAGHILLGSARVLSHKGSR